MQSVNLSARNAYYGEYGTTFGHTCTFITGDATHHNDKLILVLSVQYQLNVFHVIYQNQTSPIIQLLQIIKYNT